ncbi:unnamed protein product [Periconia digitata]|uniref:C2H2-type domain-containing protein n=1 Tax=Periconia digitata TaxID=1303443 RepID=A0A9W4XYY8_9PLEO|nr:unnamed protein product [Periconia digitata]
MTSQTLCIYNALFFTMATALSRSSLIPLSLGTYDAMAIQQHRSKPSILLALKVLQFVHQLRRRLKPRASIFGRNVCLGLESKGLCKLAKGLPHTGLQKQRHSNHAPDRVCKNWNNGRTRTRPRLKLQTAEKGNGLAIQNHLGKEMQHMLHSADQNFAQTGRPLSAIAANNGLFVQQRNLDLRQWSLNDITQALVQVHDAINVICACRSQFDDEWLIAQGQKMGLNFDEIFIANYEHLLFQLQGQLIDALGRKVLEALLLGDHDKKQHRLLVWFTEFSDKPRPLSTFPWTIKPSLAVLWGVCWMFYNPPNSRQSAQRRDFCVSRDAVLSNVQLKNWDRSDADTYVNFGMGLVGTAPLPEAQQQARGVENIDLAGGDNGDYLRLRNADVCDPANLEFAPQASRAFARQGFSGLSTYCSPFPAGSNIDHFSLNNNLLSDLQGNTATSLAVYPQQLDDNILNQDWLSLPPDSLPQRPTNHLTSAAFSPPSIRVTGSADSFAAPQPDFAAFSNASLYSPTSQEPQALSPLNTSFNPFLNSNMGNCQPLEPVSPHNIKAGRHERNSSINSVNSNFPTPTSMAGCHSPLLSPADDRRPSMPRSVGHSRQPSEDRSSVSQFGDDIGSPGRKNHSYKRAEEPPKNAEGKMVCKHDECIGQTFDRKCEWSKHMDKHDRPYKCNVAGCEKLQGFTYSGGLLRHEREVHKMHGGTKKSLFCPFTDCKRSSGSGFTRKENLAEHIRRVHRRTSMSADLGHLIISRAESLYSSPITESRMPSESPFQRILEVPGEESGQNLLKRKRNSESAIPELGEESDLRAEIKRLRKDNEEKDSRLHQLEAAVMALQQARR